MKHSKILFIAAAFAAFGFVACGGDDNSNPAASGGSSGGNKAWNYLNPNIPYGEFVDSRDGQVYKTVQIGTQIWMAQNMNYKTENSREDLGYGGAKLYRWHEAMEACPTGWHLPSREEFVLLITSVGGMYAPITPAVGKILKSAKGWMIDVDGKGTDDFGFSAIPAGSCNAAWECKSSKKEFSIYTGEESVTPFLDLWTSTETDVIQAFAFSFSKGDDISCITGGQYTDAYSVRCVKD